MLDVALTIVMQVNLVMAPNTPSSPKYDPSVKVSNTYQAELDYTQKENFPAMYPW